MKNDEAKQHLPEFLRPYFWDTDFDVLDKEEDKMFIIPRLYTKGRWEGFRWVEKNYPDEDIIKATKDSRNLNAIVANYISKNSILKKRIWPIIVFLKTGHGGNLNAF